jgi:Mrp family chromosome partitioning ATPase
MNAIPKAIPTLASRLEDVTQYAEVKRLTDTIMALQTQKGFRSLAVLSLFPGEGKTLFTAAMAMSYAATSSSRVLAVDATTAQDPQSLILKQCLGHQFNSIHYLSLEDYRRGIGNSNGRDSGNGYHSGSNGHDPEWTEAPAMEADWVGEGTITLVVKKKSDQSLIQAIADEHAADYGLTLIDTAPLSARNRGNIDPLLVARMADASVVMASPRLLNSPHLHEHMAVLRDPALHVLGLISNEEFFK